MPRLLPALTCTLNLAMIGAAVPAPATAQSLPPAAPTAPDAPGATEDGVGSSLSVVGQRALSSPGGAGAEVILQLGADIALRVDCGATPIETCLPALAPLLGVIAAEAERQ